MTKLYVVATPIGNLKDITLRALDVLRLPAQAGGVDFIIAEDTRVARKLLSHYEIYKPLISYTEHSGPKTYQKIADMLNDGKSAALVTDAGTPGISDPGARLVDFIRREISEIKIEPIPGPSALIAAASVAGISMEKFLFLGFPPHKKGRQTFFKEVSAESVKRPVIFYESPHRVDKAFAELAENLGKDAEVIVARELTKIYEEIWRGTVSEAREHFQGERKRGEFVIIVPRK